MDAPPEGAGSPGATAPEPAGAEPVVPAGAEPLLPGLVPPRVGSGATQLHAAGQSASVVQVIVFGVHEPGKLVVVVHISGGGATGVPPSALASPEEPPPDDGLALPVPVPATGVGAPPPPPEQAVIIEGAQVKPAPQSASALQGSCHLYLHVETLFDVHVGVVAGGGSHCVFGAQAIAVDAQPSVAVSA
jgi:hypothetical protein